MSICTHDELINLVRNGLIKSNCPQKELFPQVNGASIDLTLGNEFQLEGGTMLEPVDPRDKNTNHMRTIHTEELLLWPGDFVLAHSREYFDLPLDISVWVTLKSSAARCGLDHTNAGYGDPGWHGAQMTFELKNNLKNRPIRLTAGMPIAQIIVFRGNPVPVQRSYRARGQYNKTTGATGSKGVQ